MAYTGSLATTGLGSTFSINTSTPSTPTFVVIGEIVNAPQSGRMAKTADVTNLQSTNVEWIATLIDSGSFEITVNRVATDPGQLAIETAFEGLSKKQFKVVLPLQGTQVSLGDAYTFLAIVEEFTSLADLSPEKAIQSKIKLKTSGNLTFTPGS